MRTKEIREANCCSLRLSSARKVRRQVLFFPCSWAALVYLGIAFPPTQPSCSAQDHGLTCGAQTVFKMADAELKQKRYDQAEQELDRLRSCASLSSIDTFNLGWLYGRAHNFKKALTEFNSVGQNVPDQKTHQYATALAQFELEDYKAAIETLTNNSGSQYLSQESVNLLAVSYSKIGLYRESYTVLTDELHRHPDDRMTYLNLVTLLCDEGEVTKAVDVADRAVSIFPRDAEILVVRGAAYTLVGETAKARADFKAAIKTSPLYGPPRFFLAVSEYRDGNYGVACDEISQALRAGVKDSDLYYLLAEATLRLDPTNSQKAIIELNRSVAMNPRQVQALSLRGKLRLQQHDLKDAVSDLELAHKIDPASPSGTYNLARAYFALGKTEEASALSKQLAASGADAVSELTDQKLKSALGLQSREQNR
jgi:tetratricopeptide (TPR) repeat protein